MAIYKDTHDSLMLEELHLYGSQRLGVIKENRLLAKYVNIFPPSSTFKTSMPNTPLIPYPYTLAPYHFGKKHYELTDWLGNVRVVINDRKTPVNIGTTTVGYKAQVINVNDYYSFGSTINERTYDYSSTKFRFAFNGKENDNEIMGNGNFQDYGARMYDTRLARFISPDPIIVMQHKYQDLSPYQFAGNKPIVAIDLDGKEDMWVHTFIYDNGTKQQINIFSTDDNYAIQKQQLATQLGINVSNYGTKGVLATETMIDASGNMQTQGYYANLNIEVSFYKSQGLANRIGRYLEGSKLDQLNAAFIKRYYGSEGQARFAEDLEQQSTYVKGAGIAIGLLGAITGNPILVEGGVGLYNVGDRMEMGSTALEITNDLSKGKGMDATMKGLKFVTSEVVGFSIELQNTSNINKLLFKGTSDYLMDKYTNINKSEKENKNRKNEKSKSRIE